MTRVYGTSCSVELLQSLQNKKNFYKVFEVSICALMGLYGHKKTPRFLQISLYYIPVTNLLYQQCLCPSHLPCESCFCGSEAVAAKIKTWLGISGFQLFTQSLFCSDAKAHQNKTRNLSASDRTLHSCIFHVAYVDLLGLSRIFSFTN